MPSITIKVPKITIPDIPVAATLKGGDKAIGAEISGPKGAPLAANLGGTDTPIGLAANVGGTDKPIGLAAKLGGTDTPIGLGLELGGSDKPIALGLELGGTGTPIGLGLDLGGIGTLGLGLGLGGTDKPIAIEAGFRNNTVQFKLFGFIPLLTIKIR